MSNSDSNDDQQNIEIILLTIGALIGVAIVIFVIARAANNATLTRMMQNDSEIQVVIARRIAPVGSVVLDGEVAADPGVTAVVDAAEAPTILTGPQVYNQACIACHGGGIAGAPKTGDGPSWSARIGQGMDVLNDHAINGFQGAAGVMPAKGGYVNLSDEEIIAAVQYLVDEVQ